MLDKAMSHAGEARHTQKTICNVYKGGSDWHKPPPGIGDFIRGCSYLHHHQSSGLFNNEYHSCMNLDLTPCAAYMNCGDLYFPSDHMSLVNADEYFYAPRDGSVVDRIAEFLSSEDEHLLISTNNSISGIDDLPPRETLTAVRTVFDCSDKFDAARSELKSKLCRGYTVLHIRDQDRDSPLDEPHITIADFTDRVKAFISIHGSLIDAGACICISNNEALRDKISREYGYFSSETKVHNTGFRGVFSSSELSDMLLMRDAKIIFSISAYHCNSGFAVWASRLYDVPFVSANLATVFAK